MISAQDFRNKYEKLYNEMRLYLWPYDILELLGNIEVNIYSAFIDRDKLYNDYSKLETLIREDLSENDELKKAYDDLGDLICNNNDKSYHAIMRVGEKDPQTNKSLKSFNDPEDDIEGGEYNEDKQSKF